VQTILQRYRDLQDIIAILGVEELSEEDKLGGGRARGSNGSCHSRSTWRAIHRLPRQLHAVSDTIRSFDEICAGKWDHLPEVAFLYVGGIEEAAAKGRATRGEAEK